MIFAKIEDFHEIPEILMSGHHGNVAKWQKQQSEALTQDRRPDLWEEFEG